MWYFRCISTLSRAVFEFIMCGLLSYCLVDQSLARLFIEIVVPSVLLINMLSASSFAEKCAVLTVLHWTHIGLVFGFSENQHSFMLSCTFDLRPVHLLASEARVFNKTNASLFMQNAALHAHERMHHSYRTIENWEYRSAYRRTLGTQGIQIT